VPPCTAAFPPTALAGLDHAASCLQIEAVRGAVPAHADA